MRYTFMGLTLWLMASVMTVSATSLEVEGLGKFPFRQNMEVTAAGGAAESFLRTGDDSRRDIEKMVRLLSVPPGMESCFGNGSFSDDTVRMYQIRTKDMEGEYMALLFVVYGKECPCRNGRDKKALSFWNNAFQGKTEKPDFLFGTPKISLAEYGAALERRLEKEKVQHIKAVLSDFSPWQRYKNKDGSYRWSQESRLVVFREGYGALPLWTDSHLYKAGKVYYLITVVGSHMARNKLGKYVLYGIDGLERESL